MPTAFHLSHRRQTKLRESLGAHRFGGPMFPPGDVRYCTHGARLGIGFAADISSWWDAHAEYENGKLKILGHPVMEAWEAPYMRRLAEIATAKGGAILEVGFGLGISSRFVQDCQPAKHVIIEANVEVYDGLEAFAASAAQYVQPVLGFWQDVLPNFADASFDGILFDTYPLEEDEIHQNHYPFFAHAHRVLKPGGVFTYYSDEIDEISLEHLVRLQEAGFDQVDFEVCEVDPPADCEYWSSSTIVAPIVVR